MFARQSGSGRSAEPFLIDPALSHSVGASLTLSLPRVAFACLANPRGSDDRHGSSSGLRGSWLPSLRLVPGPSEQIRDIQRRGPPIHAGVVQPCAADGQHAQHIAPLVIRCFADSAIAFQLSQDRGFGCLENQAGSAGFHGLIGSSAAAFLPIER